MRPVDYMSTAFPTLMAGDDIRARMARIWSPTFRARVPVYFHFLGDQDEEETESRKLTRKQAADALRHARREGELVEIGREPDGTAGYSIHMHPRDWPEYPRWTQQEFAS
jgi:hypothetical protein